MMGARTILTISLAVLLSLAACSSDGESEGSDATADGTATADETETAEPTETAEATETAEPTEAPDTTTTTELAPLTDSFRGVTSSSINVGVLQADLAELRDLDLAQSNFGDMELIAETLFADVNANGGILGRELVLDYQSYSVLEVADVEATCVEMTEDHENFAVLGAPTGPIVAPAVTCFTDTYDTIVVGGTQSDELLAQSSAPWVSDLMGSTRLYSSSIDLFAADGLLDSQGIAVIAAASDQQSIEDVVVPALAANGVEPTVVLYSETSGDQAAAQAEATIFAERLRTDGVDTIVVVGAIPTMFAALDANGWTGRRLFIDPAGTVSRLGRAGDIPREVFDGLVVAVGQIGDDIVEAPAARECIDKFTAANPEIEVLPPSEVPEGDPDWAQGIMQICSQLEVFKQVATAAGPDLTNDSFREAATTITDSFPTAFSPFNTLGPDKVDSADGLRLAEYDSTIGDEGGLEPLGPIVDVTEIEN